MSDLARLTVWDDHGDRCQNVFERHCLHQAAARRANVLVTEIVALRAVLRVKRGAALLRYRGNRHRFGQPKQVGRRGRRCRGGPANVGC